MNELELQVRVDSTISNVVNSLLYQNGVSAHIVENALSKSLSDVRANVITEILASKLEDESTQETDDSEVSDNG